MDYSLESAVNENNIERTKNYVQKLIARFRVLSEAENYNELSGLLTSESRLHSRLFESLRNKSGIAYFVGFYAAMLEVYEKVLAWRRDQERVAEELRGSFVGKLEQFDAVIVAVHDNEGIRHGQLADILGMKKNTLTGLMEKVLASGAVECMPVGKYKHYYLAPVGEQYYADNQVRIRQQREVPQRVAPDLKAEIEQIVMESMQSFLDVAVDKRAEIEKLLSDCAERGSLKIGLRGSHEVPMTNVDRVLAESDRETGELWLMFEEKTPGGSGIALENEVNALAQRTA